MLRKFHKTLSIGLSGLLALGISVGVANASGRTPNVLHEMVPHVVLPETIQYNRTAKNAPGPGFSGTTAPHVATYVAFPSYQVPHTTVFRPVGQSVYPVSPPSLPAPLPRTQPEPDAVDAATEDFILQEIDGEDIVLSTRMTEPIRLASSSAAGPPALPVPQTITQTRGLFCQQPAKPPSAWAFSSPIFRVASVPAGWGGQVGGITHGNHRGVVQHVGFHPANGAGADSAMAGAAPQGGPQSTFQMGHNAGPQVQVLPNGMLLLTLPPSHHACGLLRCRSGCTPRSVLLPAGHAPAGFTPSAPQCMMPPQMMPGMMPQEMMAPPQTAMLPGGFGTPFMHVSQQHPQMMPQMQTVPVQAMTPMGPAIVGFQQVPMMNPMMNPMANPMAMMDPQMQQLQQMQQIQQQIQAAVAMANPAIASQWQMGEATENDDDAQSSAMAVVATPFGYAIQVPVDALQTDAAAQFAQLHQELIQSHMQAQSQALMQMPMQMPMQMQMHMPMNPFAGLYATPFGYIAMNQGAGQFGFGNPMMMHVGHSPMGMGMHGGGMSVSDMLQIMAFINSNQPQQRRPGMAARVAERRENRRAMMAHNDPFAHLMQAWTTPFVAPDTTLRMPARNAFPYGHFGAQAPPVGTANYGGFHNLYFGNTTFPGRF